MWRGKALRKRGVTGAKKWSKMRKGGLAKARKRKGWSVVLRFKRIALSQRVLQWRNKMMNDIGREYRVPVEVSLFRPADFSLTSSYALCRLVFRPFDEVGNRLPPTLYVNVVVRIKSRGVPKMRTIFIPIRRSETIKLDSIFEWAGDRWNFIFVNDIRKAYTGVRRVEKTNRTTKKAHYSK